MYVVIPGRRYTKVARQTGPDSRCVVAFIDTNPPANARTWRGTWYEPKSWTQRGRIMAAAYWKSLAAELDAAGLLPEGALR